MMNDKINKKYEELQMELDSLHKKIESNKNYWKKSLANQFETKVGCVLMQQLEKDEIDGSEVDKAQHEFVRLQDFFHRLDNEPLISVSSTENNPMDSNAPRLVLSGIAVNGLDWNEDFSTENTSEIMQYSGQQQIDNSINTTRRKIDCEYD
jgi:hypothetical protein